MHAQTHDASSHVKKRSLLKIQSKAYLNAKIFFSFSHYFHQLKPKNVSTISNIDDTQKLSPWTELLRLNRKSQVVQATFQHRKKSVLCISFGAPPSTPLVGPTAPPGHPSTSATPASTCFYHHLAPISTCGRRTHCPAPPFLPRQYALYNTPPGARGCKKPVILFETSNSLYT